MGHGFVPDERGICKALIPEESSKAIHSMGNSPSTLQGSNSSITMIRMTMYLIAAGYQIVVYCYNGQRFTTAVRDVTGESPSPGSHIPPLIDV